jgi:hypothetical protein
MADPFDARDGAQFPPNDSDEICETCGGGGEVCIGNRYVTRDMAIEAGDRSLEGQFYGHVMGECPDCDGTGLRKPEITS